MTEEEIIDYVMNTPNNSNPAVLKGMLDSYGGSSSDEIFWVTYTYDEEASSESKEVYTCDRTFQEIKEAFNNNKNVIAREDHGDGYTIIPLTDVTDTMLEFCLVRASSIDIHFDLDYEYVEHTIEDEIEYIYVKVDNISIPKQ